jgi:hypothetical protein
MDIHSLVNCLIIFVGAVIMLISIIGTKGLKKALHFVPERQRKQVARYLGFHRVLMAFFLCGYIVVLVAFAFHFSFISESFVSIIFFFGAVFVFIGVTVQARLMTEVQNTLQGILPICCKCKKIRNSDANQKDPNSWKKIEDYLTERAHVNFSHGLCPECFEWEMKDLKNMS